MSLLDAIRNPQTDLDLTTAQAETILAAWLGEAVSCTRVTRLRGGMINTVLRLDYSLKTPGVFETPGVLRGAQSDGSAVIKLNRDGAGFLEEARALRYLKDQTLFPSPQVYRVEVPAQTLPYACLLMETLPGTSLDQATLTQAEHDHLDRQLAEVLLELHSHIRPTFGAIDEPGSTDWPAIFLPRLLEVRQQAEVNQRLSKEVLAKVDQAIQKTSQALQDAGQPTLIHSDIWAANLIIQSVNGGWRLTGIVDPGLQYADVEMELAYLEVFGGSRPAFFSAYTARQPLRPGYDYRRLFYWLNTCLIHVWLFGDEFYCQSTVQVADAILTKSF